MGNDMNAASKNSDGGKQRRNSKLSQFIKCKLNKLNKNRSNRNDDLFIIKYIQSNKSNDDLLDINGLDQRRLVFVSLFGLYQSWKKVPSVSLYTALFIMPLKSKWIYNPSKYTKEFQESFICKIATFSDNAETAQFIELLKWKDSQGLVFWMLDDHKSDIVEKADSVSTISPFWGHLSTKLTTLYDPITRNKYEALKLDEKWWINNTKYDIKYKMEILSELYLLTMNFKTIQEIIYQSNPDSLHAITVYHDNHSNDDDDDDDDDEENEYIANNNDVNDENTTKMSISESLTANNQSNGDNINNMDDWWISPDYEM